MGIYMHYRDFLKRMAACLLVFVISLTAFGFGTADAGDSEDDFSFEDLWKDMTGGDGSDQPSDYNKQAEADMKKGLPVQLGVTEDTDGEDLIRFEEIEANENLVLYADMKNGLFALKNRRSGRIWYSTPNDSELDQVTRGVRKTEVRSQILLHYIPVAELTTIQAPKVFNSQSMCVSKGNVRVTKINGGIRVVYSFGSTGFVVPVEYTLEKDYLKANIDVKGIKEGNKAVITAIQLLPYFGAGNRDAEGSLFVPDGCGALIHFNNGVSTMDYDEMVYGDELAVLKDSDKKQSESIRMPVFGVLTGGEALMGVITNGDAAASVTAVNGNGRCGYNGVGSKLNLRLMTQKTVFNKTAGKETLNRLTAAPDGVKAYTVRYYPLAGAGYVEMATRYRDYLVAEKQLKKSPEKPAFNVDLYGSIDSKSAFFGIPYTKKTALTTFDQAEKILDSLKHEGIGDLAVRYIGWSNYGVLNRSIPAKASPIPSLGGRKGFLALEEYMQKNGIAFYPDVDFVRFRSGGGSSAAKTTFSETALQYEFMRSVYATRLGMEPYRLLTPQKLQTAAEKFLKSYKKLGLRSISMSTLGNMLYSNLHPKKGTYRSEFPAWASKAVQPYQKAGIKIATDSANAYMIPYASRIYNAPTCSSAYDSFDEDIPFYQMVLHGYVTVTTAPMVQSMDPAITLLSAVETGSELLCSGMYAHSSKVTGTRYDNLYSTTYTLWQETAAEQYKRYQPILSAVYDKPITAHEKVAENVMMTTFEGGYKVIVNYSDKAVTVNGITIEAYGFTGIGQ